MMTYRIRQQQKVWMISGALSLFLHGGSLMATAHGVTESAAEEGAKVLAVPGPEERLAKIEERLLSSGLSTLTPEEVIIFASVSQANFSYILGQMQRYAPTIVSSTRLFSLINTLDALYAIGEKLGMADWGSSPVIVAGQDLTQQAIKWIRYVELDERSLASFARWANESTIGEATRSQEEFIRGDTGLEQLLLWNHKVASLLGYLRQRQNLDHYAIVTVHTLQGVIVEAITKCKEALSASATQAVISSLTGGPSVEKFSTFLYGRILAAKGAEELSAMAPWVLALARHMHGFSEGISEMLRNQPGEMALELLRKHLAAGSCPEEALFAEVLGLVTLKNLYQFEEIFSDYPWQRLSLDNAKIFTHLALKVADLLIARGEEHAVKRIQKLLDRLVHVETILSHGIEGIYELSIGHERGILTVTDLGDRNLFLGLRYFVNGERERAQDITFNKIAYSRPKQVWHAHSLEVINPSFGVATFPIQALHFIHHPEASVQAKLGAKHHMLGKIIIGTDKKVFSANKIRSFQPFAQAGQGSEDFVGRYKGKDMVFVVSYADQKYAGTITFGQKYQARIELNYGLLSDGMLRLTSGTQKNGRYVHVRSKLHPEGKLEMEYIVSGDEQTKTFFLTKEHE